MIDDIQSSDTSYPEVACSILHKVVARPKLLPYTDMVKWIVENVTIEDKEFVTSRQVVIDSFKLKDIRRMYHLTEPHMVYDKAFVEKFSAENEEPFEVIKQWMSNPSTHKMDRTDMYLVSSIATPYLYISTMLCRLFGYENTTKFSVEWVPPIDAASNSIIMDWATILSNNLAHHIIEYRKNHFVTTRAIHSFYMCASVMDVVCFIFPFPIMGWKWTHQDPTSIHVYHKSLWKYCFSERFYQICQGVMLPIHQAAFDKKAPRLSEEANIDIQPLARWVGEELFTYIRVFGSTAPPHVLLWYVPDKLLAR